MLAPMVPEELGDTFTDLQRYSVGRHARTAVREVTAAYAVTSGADYSGAADAPAATVVTGMPDARAVHKSLKTLKALGNDVRMRFLDGLRTLHDHNLCYELGYSSYQQYCDLELGLARSTAFEYLRAAIALEVLPVLRGLFRRGELSWQQVREICRVASADTEVAWIRFAIEESVADLLVEVKDAVRTGRKTPREKRLGLPNLLVKVSFDMTLEEKERLRAAFAVMGEALDGYDDADERPVLIRWADAVLAGAITGPRPPQTEVDDAGDDVEVARRTGSRVRPTPAQTVLYRTCPECSVSTVETASGPVAVTSARVADLAPVSNRVVIEPHEELAMEPAKERAEHDQPNTARLARQVLARDGLKCASPGCGSRRNLHAHHIVFRAHGGRTALANEVAVCDTCHALLHKGLVELTGSPDGGLVWTRRPLDGAPLAEQSTYVDSAVNPLVGGVPLVERGQSAYVDSVLDCTAGVAATMRGQSTYMDSRELEPNRFRPRPREDIDLNRRLRQLEEGLVGLNFTPDEAAERIRDAYTSLNALSRVVAETTGDAPQPPSDDEIITLALYGEAKAAAVWEFHAKRARGGE